jgi:integrase
MSSTEAISQEEIAGPLTMNEEMHFFRKYLEKNTKLAESSIDEYINKVSKLDEPLDFEEMEVQEVIDELTYKLSRSEGRSAIKKYFGYLLRTKKWPIETRQKVTYVENEMMHWDLKTSSELNKEDVKRKFLRLNEIETFHSEINERLSGNDFKNSERKTDEVQILPLFLFETACRIEEALAVKINNIKWEESKIKLTKTKGGKIRNVNLDKALPLVRRHVKKHDITGNLFLTSRDDDYRALNRHFKNVGEDLYGRTVTTHWFRHSFATNRAIFRMKNGVPKGEIKDEIKEYLGHDSVDTTEKYIGAAEELERENIYEEGGSFDLKIK